MSQHKEWFSSIQVSSHAGGTVTQHEQYHDPESEAAKWNPAITKSIINTCDFPHVKTLSMKKPLASEKIQ